VFSEFVETVRNVSFDPGSQYDGKGLLMKKVTIAAVAALAFSASSVFAADMPLKAIKAPAQPPAWDLAFGSAIASDYVWRGITQSNHKPSVAAYFEPRYNINKDMQLYAGLGGASIDFPNRAAAEVDLYAGFRPTFGKFAFDFGFWYYYYPGGQDFNAGTPQGPLPNGNLAKENWSFYEIFAKVNYSVTDQLGLGAFVYYSPNVLNTGADGVYFGGNAKYTFPALANGMQFYASGEAGYWDLGTSDPYYGTLAFPGGIPYKSYTTWNLGIGWTYKVFTVDLRYIDTDLNKGDCNAFTSDHTATGNGNLTNINPSGLGSNWCGATFVARLSADLTVNTNLK
jgi:uncharacterized protein (TIGR02001 family)